MYDQLVSIVIPMYNVEKYVGECLNSVLAQTFREIEVVCIDDASTDQTLKVAEGFAKSDTRVHILINDENKGPAYTRNRGLDVAQGKYIYFLDSDDMITKNAIEELWQEAEGKDLDVIFFDGQVIYEDEDLKQRFKGYRMQHFGDYEPVMNGMEIFNAMQTNREWAVNPPREFWRRDFLINAELQFENGIIHEDELFSTLAVMQAERCSVMKKQYFIRRFRQNSIMTSIKTSKNMDGYFKCITKIMEYLWKHMDDTEDHDAIDSYLNGLKSVANRYLLFHDDWKLRPQDSLEFAVKKMLELEKYQLFVKDDLQKLCCAGKISIYGAGKAARRVFAEMLRVDVMVDGFVVTDKQGDEETLFGLPIVEISDCQDVRSRTFVVSIMNSDIVAEVKQRLYNLGAKDIIVPRF